MRRSPLVRGGAERLVLLPLSPAQAGTRAEDAASVLVPANVLQVATVSVWAGPASRGGIDRRADTDLLSIAALIVGGVTLAIGLVALAASRRTRPA